MLELLQGNKKKEFELKIANFSNRLSVAFSQIRKDIEDANKKIESNQKDLENITKWIDYLHRTNQDTALSHSDIAQKYEKLHENHQKLHTSHSQLLDSHGQLLDKHEKVIALTADLKARHHALDTHITQKAEHIDQLQKDLSGYKTAYGKEIQTLKAWVDYLSSMVEKQKKREDELKTELSTANKAFAERHISVKEALNGLKSENNELRSMMHSLKEELANARKELEESKNAVKTVQIPVEEPKSEVIEQYIAPQPVSSGFQRQVMTRVMSNRRSYVLNFIVNLIKENKYTTKEIEEIVVNEKQLCGRTSFYAYLKELKLKGRINYAEIDDRQILISTDSQQKLM